eukprot:SAG31_NODE_37820_length_301_cov_0.772277_2_plen_23_part_01
MVLVELKLPETVCRNIIYRVFTY